MKMPSTLPSSYDICDNWSIIALFHGPLFIPRMNDSSLSNDLPQINTKCASIFECITIKILKNLRYFILISKHSDTEHNDKKKINMLASNTFYFT